LASQQEGIVRSRTGLVILAVSILTVAVACDRNSGDRSSSPTPTQTSGHPAEHGKVAAATSPKGLAAQFQQYYAQHTLLAVRQMRSVLTATPTYRQAADAELEEYTEELAQVVGGTFGEDQGERFEEIWQGSITHFSAYAEAVAANDPAAKQQARAGLLADADAYGEWFAGVSDGRTRASEAAEVMRTHVEQLMEQADAYAARDYDQAYMTERQAYEHMFAAGTELAKADLPPKEAAALDAPVEKLRAAFAMLLGEHLQLIIDTQRATFAGAPQFEAAAAQVNANTDALTKGMGAIVGPRKAEEFQAVWAEHVEGLLEYSTAVASNDQAEKTAAREEMRGYGARLALYLSDIVRNELPLEPLTAALGEHDQHLVDQINAYAAKRYDEAQEMELEGYEQMLGVADTILGALQKTVKPGLPVGGSQTGGGGTARRPR
jgi:hypothetical protein